MKPNSRSAWIVAVALAAAFQCVNAQPPGTYERATDNATPAVLLAQAEQIQLSNRELFLRILRHLHDNERLLTSTQRWHLKFLDAMRSVSDGAYGEANPVLQDIIQHSGNPSLAARATAQLIQVKALSHQYEEAYVLANTLMASLPEISDPATRLSVLGHVIQMMNNVGQYDLALKYARQMKRSFPSGKGQCEGSVYETQTLHYSDNKLTSSSPEFQKAIELCLSANQVVFANTMRLDLAGLLIDEGHTDRAITLLHKVAPSVRKANYQFHVAALNALLADAYTRQGDDANARNFIAAALAANGVNNSNWIEQYANKDLYQLEKREGHDAAALTYYEKYVAQQEASMDDTKARALAYQMVKQEVLAKKMRVDALSKENRILQLRQTLADKATETSRLYIILLLVVIVFIALLLYKIKHSQLRFRRMARHDGLTNAFNRQHFLDEARRTLHRLQKADAGACLVLLDLDHFKQVNDTHGHAVGDDVLTHTVAICMRELRASDVFGRLGGEEFGILMPACSCEQGMEIASRIRRMLAASPIKLESGTEVQVSASFGLACSSVSGYNLHALLSVADAALYRAKGSGRNQLVVGTRDDVPASGAAGVLDPSRT